jgi:tetratricopeptide (TPR) repeat protein
LASALFLAALLLYLPSLRFDFTIDDPLLTTKNEEISRFEGNYLPFFTAPLFSGTDQSRGNSNLYRPLLTSSIAFNYRLAGYRFDPVGFHALNVLLYGLCVVVVFYFVHSILASLGRDDPRLAMLAALLFLVFPSHLESVCNVKHREEVLACLLGLSAWLAASRPPPDGSRSRVWRVGAPFLFLLALLSKESAALLLPCMLIWELAQRRPFAAGWRRVPEHLYSFSLAMLVYLLLRFHALGSLLGPPGTRAFFEEDSSLFFRGAVASTTFLEYYLWDQLIALRLDPAFSSRFLLTAGERPAVLDLAAALLVAVVGVISAWRWLTRRSPVCFWVLFVLITSSLTFHLVPIGVGGAYRLFFTPSVGLCVLVALSVEGLVTILAKRTRLPRWQRAWASSAATLALVVFYGHTTYERMGAWRDDGRVFSYSAQVGPRNPLSHYAAGQHLGRIGRTEEMHAFYEQSLDLFVSFRDQPQLFDERALDAFSVVATETAYREVGRDPQRAVGLSELAIEQFDRLLALRQGRIDTNATAPYYVKALALKRLGRRAESLEACRAGLAIAYHRGLDQLLRSLTPGSADPRPPPSPE